MESSSQNGTSSQEDFNVDIDALTETQVKTPGGEGAQPEGEIVLTNAAGETEHVLDIDEDFKTLPQEEGLIRTYQRRFDRVDSAHSKYVKDTEFDSRDANLFRRMAEEDGLLMAYLNEVKPELVQNRDIGANIKEQLIKEFGEGFEPELTRDEAEKKDPGGKDWKYFHTLDNIASKTGSTGDHAKSVKEYLARIQTEADAGEATKKLQIEQTKKELKMQDAEIKAVSDWGLELSFKELVKVHRFLRKFPTRNPELQTVPGVTQTTKTSMGRDAFKEEMTRG